MTTDIGTQIAQVIDPVIIQMDYELVGVEYIKSGRYSTLRIYIDKPTGVDVEDCAKVSEQVSAILDVEDVINLQYTLEVSSPGIERPLFYLAHYRRFLGAKVKLRLHRPHQGRKKITGDIKAVYENEGNIELVCELENIMLPFQNIEKANLVAQF